MSLHQQVVEEIAQHLGVTSQDIDPNAQLTDDLGLGSLQQADLLEAVATKFNVTFNPSDVEGVKTVNDIVVMVEDLSLE